MESPPPYYSSGPKKSNTGLIIGIILGVFGLCCVLPLIVAGGFGLWGYGKLKGLVACTFTFTNVQRAVEDYATAHDGKLPNAETWQTDIKPFYAEEVAKHKKEQSVFTTDPNAPLTCDNGDSPETGLTFNKALSGKKISDIKDPFHAVVVFETPKTGSNLNGEYKAPSFESSPLTFGKHRGWYVANVSGGLSIVNRGGQMQDVNVNDSGVKVTNDSQGSNFDIHSDDSDPKGSGTVTRIDTGNAKDTTVNVNDDGVDVKRNGKVTHYNTKGKTVDINGNGATINVNTNDKSGGDDATSGTNDSKN